MKVWYVYNMSSEYGDILVDSIWSSEEKAEIRKKYLNDYYDDNLFYKVNDYTLDSNLENEVVIN